MISFEKAGKMYFSPFLTQQLNNYYILERLFSPLKKWVWKKTWTWEKKGREMPMIIYLPPTITPLLQILFLLICTTYVRNSCDHLTHMSQVCKRLLKNSKIFSVKVTKLQIFMKKVNKKGRWKSNFSQKSQQKSQQISNFHRKSH